MELEFVHSLVIIFGISAFTVYALGKLNIPPIVGFLVAGAILGPHGFAFIKDVHEVEFLAEIGIILLMFTIGLEFSFKNLLMLRVAVFGGGFLQVTLTLIVVTLVSYFYFVQTLPVSVFNGFLVSLSSTAIVLKMLLDKNEAITPYGRTSIGMLLFQDLCVVPFMLLIPILAGKEDNLINIVAILLKAIVVISVVFFAARWLVPRALHQVVHTKSRELFIFTIMLICLGTALITSKLGLSLALGAFLAGIIISESDYASQAISDILPFKESFSSIFFISIGMLMNIHFVMPRFLSVGLIVIAIIGIKIAIIAVSSFVLGQSLRISVQSGFYLSQVGEFSFVLAVAGKEAGLLTEHFYQLFLSASVFSMLLTPLMMQISPHIASWLTSRPAFRRMDRIHRPSDNQRHLEKTSDHVIIVGFGMNGSNLAKVLRESAIPYIVLELNSSTVRTLKKRGEPIFYGDGTRVEILHKLGIQRAKVLVIAISDAASARRIVQVARQENPLLYVIVRTRFVAEVDDLKSMGANEVIPEEFETSIELFSRVLHYYHVPRNLIGEYIDIIRKDSYKILRTVELPEKSLAQRYKFLAGIDTETYLVKKDSTIKSHSLKEVSLRAETGATVIAVQRGEEIHHNPSPDFVLKAGDIVLLIGKREALISALRYFDPGGAH